MRWASFQSFWPLALAIQAPPAIILAALRRFRGAALFRGPRPSPSQGVPFWPSGLTLRSSRPAYGGRLIWAVGPHTDCSGGLMPYTKTVVCFANSRKTAGRCIAGKEWNNGIPGEWFRPVSSRPTHEISEEERRFQNGQDAKLLDIIAIPCALPQPSAHQRENHVIDPGYYWSLKGTLAWTDISAWLDTPQTLWGIGHGSYSGQNNRVAIGQEDGSSLYLVAVPRLRLLVGRKAPEYPDSKRGVRGEFIYQGSVYRMDVTDPFIEREYLRQADGRYEITNPVLCISLGDPYQGYFYKLIAAVLFEDQFR